MNTQDRRADQRRSADNRKKRNFEIILIGTQRYSDAPEEDGDSRTVRYIFFSHFIFHHYNFYTIVLRKTSYYSRYHYCKLTCAFILFTILSMIAGIIIVRLTASTKNSMFSLSNTKNEINISFSYI